MIEIKETCPRTKTTPFLPTITHTTEHKTGKVMLFGEFLVPQKKNITVKSFISPP